MISAQISLVSLGPSLGSWKKKNLEENKPLILYCQSEKSGADAGMGWFRLKVNLIQSPVSDSTNCSSEIKGQGQKKHAYPVNVLQRYKNHAATLHRLFLRNLVGNLQWANLMLNLGKHRLFQSSIIFKDRLLVERHLFVILLTAGLSDETSMMPLNISWY